MKRDIAPSTREPATFAVPTPICEPGFEIPLTNEFVATIRRFTTIQNLAIRPTYHVCRPCELWDFKLVSSNRVRPNDPGHALKKANRPPDAAANPAKVAWQMTRYTPVTSKYLTKYLHRTRSGPCYRSLRERLLSGLLGLQAAATPGAPMLTSLVTTAPTGRITSILIGQERSLKQTELARRSRNCKIT